RGPQRGPNRVAATGGRRDRARLDRRHPTPVRERPWSRRRRAACERREGPGRPNEAAAVGGGGTVDEPDVDDDRISQILSTLSISFDRSMRRPSLQTDTTPHVSLSIEAWPAADLAMSMLNIVEKSAHRRLDAGSSWRDLAAPLPDDF